MDFDLPVAHSASVASPFSPPPPQQPPTPSSTPRRSHLRQLSLAPRDAVAPSSSSSSSPSSSSFPTVSPRPRSSTDGSFPPLGHPPSPSPLSRTGSLGRSPQRRQSSISYSPRSPAFSPQQQHAASPLGLGLNRSIGAGPRASLDGRRTVSDMGSGLPEEDEGDEDGASSSDPPQPSPFSPASRNGRQPPSSLQERETSDSLTLVEKHSDLLSFIAQKESKSLELREALAQNEAELASLKQKWGRIVARSTAAGRPSPSSSNSNLPSTTGSIPTSSAAATEGGLLSPETLQTGKRFLSSLLGVGGEEEGAVSGDVSGSPIPAAKKVTNGAGAPSGTRQALPLRSSLDILASVARSGLEMVSEAREPTSPTQSTTSLSARPLSLASSLNTPTGTRTTPTLARSKRLSLMSSTSSSSSSSSNAPSSLDLVSSNNRGSSSQGGSFDSTTSNSSTSSSLFSLTPTDERSSWGIDGGGRASDDLNRLAGIGEDDEDTPRSARDTRSLVDELASSSGGLVGGGWGKRWGDLATSLTGNEHFQSSKRATLGLASTLQSTLVTLSSPPPSSPSHPLSSPSPSNNRHKPSASLAAPFSLLNPSPSIPRSQKPNHSRHPSTTKMLPVTPASDWDSEGGGGGALQEPLVPVGRSPSPRIGPTFRTFLPACAQPFWNNLIRKGGFQDSKQTDIVTLGWTSGNPTYSGFGLVFELDGVCHEGEKEGKGCHWYYIEPKGGMPSFKGQPDSIAWLAQTVPSLYAGTEYAFWFQTRSSNYETSHCVIVASVGDHSFALLDPLQDRVARLRHPLDFKHGWATYGFVVTPSRLGEAVLEFTITCPAPKNWGSLLLGDGYGLYQVSLMRTM